MKYIYELNKDIRKNPNSWKPVKSKLGYSWNGIKKGNVHIYNYGNAPNLGLSILTIEVDGTPLRDVGYLPKRKLDLTIAWWYKNYFKGIE